MIKILYKLFCPHCENDEMQETEIPFIPSEILCLNCGKKLVGHRRVGRIGGKQQVWIEYR